MLPLGHTEFEIRSNSRDVNFSTASHVIPDPPLCSFDPSPRRDQNLQTMRQESIAYLLAMLLQADTFLIESGVSHWHLSGAQIIVKSEGAM
jgi:hypothetical protein